MLTYSRVSTDAQERDGTSLETQEQACVEYAESSGWLVVERICDTASGFTLDRPGIEQVRQQLRQGVVDVVVAYAVDRVSRNQNHIGVLFDEVEQAGAKLEFVTEVFEDTAIGRFILAARAFVGEVEREKIAERTMRGKVERARSGRLPQGTGRGIYGYVYDRGTGKRTIAVDQAAVVARIFEGFCAGRSCNALANTLNADNVPAFGGGRWYPLTVRRILLNVTYTGRTVYRRTKVTSLRSKGGGKRRRRIETRDEQEWIDVPGATPTIVDAEMFEKAQQILGDPNRRLRGLPNHLYLLRGRIRCLACGTPMVGQALQRGRYRYYRCRRTYAGHAEGNCASRYVRSAKVEEAVRNQLAMVLSDPQRILAEAHRLNGDSEVERKLEGAKARLSGVEAQQRRLAHLYTSGAIPEEALKEESTRLSTERANAENRVRDLEAAQPGKINIAELKRNLPKALERLRAWVMGTNEDDCALMLDALQVQIEASADKILIEGVVPTVALENGAPDQNLVTIEQTSA